MIMINRIYVEYFEAALDGNNACVKLCTPQINRYVTIDNNRTEDKNVSPLKILLQYVGG